MEDIAKNSQVAQTATDLEAQAQQRLFYIWLITGLIVLFGSVSIAAIAFALAVCLHFALLDELSTCKIKLLENSSSN